MFHSSVVPVNRKPVLECLLACKSLCVVRICISEEIPWWSSPLWHGIRLSLCRTATAWTCGVYPVCHSCKWWLTIVCRHVTVNLRKEKWKLALVDWNITTLIAVNDRNWLAPVSLTWEYPVTELVVGLCLTDTLLLKELDHLLLCILYLKAVEEIWVDEHSCCHVCKCSLIYIYFLAILCNNLDEWKSKLLCKFPVSVIMCRNRHDSTRSVAHEYIVWYVYRNLLAIYRVDGCESVYAYTSLILCKLWTLKVALLRCLLTVCLDVWPVADLVLVLVKDWMLWWNNHVCYSE